MFKFNNQMLQIFLIIILQNLTEYINTILGKQLELNFFNILLLLNQGKKLFITSVQRSGKMQFA